MPPPPSGSNFRARALVRSGGRIPPLRRVSINSSSSSSSSSMSSSSSRSPNLPGRLASGRFALSRVPIASLAAGAALGGGMVLGAGISRTPSPPPSNSNNNNNKARTGKFGSPERRVTDALLVANAAVFLLQVLTRQRLTVWGAKINPAIRAGEWWRLLTPVMLHGNLLHLATNNFALNSLGPLTEQLSGHKRFAAVYVAAGVAGSLASFAFSPAPAVGASGAIFGVGGALAVFFWRHRDYFGKASDQVLAQLGQSLALNVGMGFVVANVDNWGHAGGLVGGALAALLLGPRMVRRDEGKTRRVCDEPPCRWLAGPPIEMK